MKRLISVVIVIAGVLAAAPAVRAQDCSEWSNQDLRGTYTAAGNGWMDLSKQFPIPGMPAGYSPLTYVEAFTFDGKGDGTGWLTMNMGGIVWFKAQTKWTYAVQSDCSVQGTYSFKIIEVNGKKTEGGTFTGSVVYVVAGKAEGQGTNLELKGIPVVVGGSQTVELTAARRISMKQ